MGTFIRGLKYHDGCKFNNVNDKHKSISICYIIRYNCKVTCNKKKKQFCILNLFCIFLWRLYLFSFIRVFNYIIDKWSIISLLFKILPAFNIGRRHWQNDSYIATEHRCHFINLINPIPRLSIVNQRSFLCGGHQRQVN